MDDQIIQTPLGPKRMSFIVHACNAHEELVAALRQAYECLFGEDYMKIDGAELKSLIKDILAKCE